MNSLGGYKETGIDWISEIPFDWNVSRSKFIFKNKSLKNFPNEPLLSVTQLDGVVLRSESNMNVWNPTDDVSGYKLIEPGDFVISLRSFEGGLELSEVRGLVSPAYTVLQTIKRIDVYYFRWLMKSYQFIIELNKHVTGIRQGKNIGWDDFSNIYITIPLVEEQKLISRYLDKKTKQIDRLVEKIQKKIELLKEQRTSTISLCVTKGLKPNIEMKNTNIKWIGKIPKNWNTIPNKYIFLEYFGGSWGDDPKDDQKENLVRVIRVTEFNMKTLCISSDIPTIRSLKLEKNSKKYIKKNDLILEKSGGGEKTPVGRVVLIDKDLPYPTINSNFTNICRPNTNIVYPKFVVYSFWSKYKNGQTLRNIKQTTGIQNLDLSEFMREIFILPEIEEQIKISNYLDNKIYKIKNMIKKLDSKISLLKEYRESFISSAVTGIIRVSEDLI